MVQCNVYARANLAPSVLHFSAFIIIVISTQSLPDLVSFQMLSHTDA